MSSGFRDFLILIFLLFLPWGHLTAQNFDIDLLKEINIENPEDDHFWMGVTNSIKWAPAAYAGGNLMYGIIGDNQEAYRYSLESVISMGIAMIITGGIKKAVNRPRPSAAYPGVIHTYSPACCQSFPSGHTALTAAMATTAAYQTGGKFYFSVPIFTYPIGVGYSRMRLGRHYPTDVFVGFLIGVGSGILGHWVTGQIVH